MNSKQRKRKSINKSQRIRKERGLCRSCPNELNLYAWECDACAIKHQERMRKLTGCKPWRPGGPGRPPKVVYE